VTVQIKGSVTQLLAFACVPLDLRDMIAVNYPALTIALIMEHVTINGVIVLVPHNLLEPIAHLPYYLAQRIALGMVYVIVQPVFVDAIFLSNSLIVLTHYFENQQHLK